VKRLALHDDPALIAAELREAAAPAADVARAVAEILADVRARGDDAVRDHARRLEGLALPERYGVAPADLSAALDAAAPELHAALELAAANIRAYHTRERPLAWRETLAQGQLVGQEIVPLGVAGLYVPGGLANYPSSVLMTAIPAQVAGVGRVVVCSPPRSRGGVAAGVAAACALLGVTDLYPIGGAQAVAAMAFGTGVVPRCDVIVGPGNAYVTEAKRQVMGEVRIDGLAGPSEVLIVADADARVDWLAADLLAQAEHGSGAMAALLDVGGSLGDRVAAAVQRLAAELDLPTGRIAIVACPDVAAALRLVNAFAPEHLELHVAGAAALLPEVRGAGAIFVGPRAATAFGDYAAGTNHVLPTGGTARFSQGLSVADFVKRVGWVELDRAAAAALAPAVATIARDEGLHAHARSAELRGGP
jgi:histidinol dehydrogenase